MKKGIKRDLTDYLESIENLDFLETEGTSTKRIKLDNIVDINLLDLPVEVQLLIYKYLTKEDLKNLALVCKTTLLLSEEDSLWKEFALERGVPLTWLQKRDIPFKKLYKDFHNECELILRDYPKFFITLFGGEHIIASLPNIKKIDDEPLLPQLKGHKVWRGDHIREIYYVNNSFTTFVTPCIRCCVKENKNSTEININPELDILTLWQNHESHICMRTERNTLWSNSSSDDAKHLDYFKRLINNEPCGRIAAEESTKPKTTFDGRSIIELTDQSEFIEKADEKVSNKSTNRCSIF